MKTALAILLLSALNCFAQFSVEQPFFLTIANAAAPFTPASLDGLTWWVDIYTNLFNGARTVPSLTNNEAVTLWVDKTPNAYQFGSVTMKYQTSGGPSNGPVVVGTLVDSKFVLVSGHWAQPTTIFFVAKTPTSYAGNSAYLMSSTNTSYRHDFRLLQTSGDGGLYAGTSYDSGVPVPVNVWRIITGQFNGNNSLVRTNGVACGVAGAAGAQACAGVILANASFGNLPLVSPLVEGLFYATNLSAADMLKVEKYLAAKHGITNAVIP